MFAFGYRNIVIVYLKSLRIAFAVREEHELQLFGCGICYEWSWCFRATMLIDFLPVVAEIIVFFFLAFHMLMFFNVFEGVFRLIDAQIIVIIFTALKKKLD